MYKSDLTIYVKEDHSSSKTAQVRTDDSDHKVSSLERIFLKASFILEIPSAVFDQLSSVHRPHYALFNMLISFAVMIISIADLVHKAQRARITWTKKGLIPWFYHPHPNSKPFGSLVDIIGLVCSIFQWIFASISYIFLAQHVDNPIKFSIWPIIFAFCIILYSRLSKDPLPRSASNLRKLNRADEFALAELATATNDFSADNIISKSRNGIVYRGRLLDGREKDISRRVLGEGDEFKEVESIHESSLAFLSRLHHRNLLGLVGYCEEGAERLLVFDCMKNGTLNKQLFHMDSSVIDSWEMRIKIAVDVSRGIDYLHNYAVPPIIHRAINSSCILLNENWMARIADFGLAVMTIEAEPDYKSDVYSFGVVLLELLTGKTATFKDSYNGGRVTSLTDFAVPRILQNEYVKILDSRIGPPETDKETEAVEMVAYTALHCVNSEGINIPNIRNIVMNLEQALSLLNDSTRIIDTEQLQNSPAAELAKENHSHKS